ncbi:uncharacterized protein RCO7_15112 [Rhynchosporium graminicola]|uniref:Uncharacterized protein n=1 Tax=Rhynchosporium graminicola TaxID=2792576 RepID=A0A1E1LKP3_9HELO|nr:uncharacterized protein RCO7_15112 [Rhynchosporium commune]
MGLLFSTPSMIINREHTTASASSPWPFSSPYSSGAFRVFVIDSKIERIRVNFVLCGSIGDVRDFQPRIALRWRGLETWDNLYLQLEVRYKYSNWSVEETHATRHWKLVCALRMAMRSVSFLEPESGAPLGVPLILHVAFGCVAVWDEIAQAAREKLPRIKMQQDSIYCIKSGAQRTTSRKSEAGGVNSELQRRSTLSESGKLAIMLYLVPR